MFDIRMVGSEVQEKAKAKSRKVCARRFWCDIRVVESKVCARRFWCDIRVFGSKVQEKVEAESRKVCDRRFGVTPGWSGPRTKRKRKPKAERYVPGGFGVTSG